MTDPKRWSDDDGELSPAERRLLRAGLTPSVPRGAKRAVWIGLAAQLPSAIAAATTASAGTGGLASALATVSLVKAAGVGVLLGATTITAVTVVGHRQPAPAPARESHTIAAPAVSAHASDRAAPPSAPAPSAPPEVAPASTAPPDTRPAPLRTPGEPLTVTPEPPTAPSIATFPDETRAPQPDTESHQIAAARTSLRVGDARRAYLQLERARHDFPNGALSQEREALSIEALRELGQTAEARRRAQAFLARYPASPHAPIARGALE